MQKNSQRKIVEKGVEKGVKNRKKMIEKGHIVEKMTKMQKNR